MSGSPTPLTWLTNLTKQNPEALLAQIRKEFKSIAGGLSDNTAGQQTVVAQYLKCFRYQDVPLLEATRVPVQQTAVGVEMYHANFVSLAEGFPVIIAAMAPQKRSEFVFWSLMWDQKVARIVCLTDVFEHSREKTSKYWPDPAESKVVEHLSIKNTGTNQEQGYVISMLEVQNKKTSETRTVEHWFYSDWPDQRGPRCTHIILNMGDKLNAEPKCTLMHCSAGIGRTGCMLTIMALKMKLEKGEPINLPEIVHSIRLSRVGCIQNDIQYIFLYWCAVLEHLKKCTLSDAEKAAIRKKLRFLRDKSTTSQCSMGHRAKKTGSPAKDARKVAPEGTAAEPTKSAFVRLTEFLSFKKKKENSTPTAESGKPSRKPRENDKKKATPGTKDKGEPKPSSK